MTREWPISDRVAAFLAEQTYDAPEDLYYSRRLSEMMRPCPLDVDTGEIFVRAFAERFGVDLTDFEPRRHFPGEGAVIPHEAKLRIAAGFSPAARRRLSDATAARMAELEEITVASLVASAMSRRWMGAGHPRRDRDVGFDPKEVAAYAGGTVAAGLAFVAVGAEIAAPGTVSSAFLPQDGAMNAAVALGAIVPASVLVAIRAVRRRDDTDED